MPTYKDVDEIIKAMEDNTLTTWGKELGQGWWAHSVKLKDNIVRLIKEAPAADVMEVKRGEWTYDADCECFVCSKCVNSALNNYRLLSTPSNFCPHCGAKMDAKNKGGIERVRCKDCVHFKSINLRKRFDGYCDLDFFARKGNNFCGKAERKNNEQNT